jgi:D-lactate dehydrogenase (cytochrome)
VLLATQALQGIHTYARDDLYVTVGVGTSLADLQADLAHDRLWVPLLSPWPDATIGGIIATSTNAPLRMRYGGVRDLVLAATVALPSGRVIRAGRPVVKNVAGYDLPKLFVGSHGTLGVITDVTLKLTPLPRARASVIVPVDTLERGLALGARLLHVCLVASAVLLCRGCDTPFASATYTLIYTAEGLAEDVRAELAEVRSVLKELCASGVIVDTPAGSDVWAAWLGGAALDSDATASPDALVRLGVAPKALPGIVSGLRMLGDAPFVADLANGLLYTRGVQDIAAVRRPARAAGGYAVVLTAAPALHGIYDVWGERPDALDLMRALKARWDPQGLLNPSALLA